MSRSVMEFRFMDGVTLYGVYDGTSDTAFSFMLDGSQAGAWKHYQDAKANVENWIGFLHPHCDCGRPGEPVIAFSHYGGGFGWPGTACRRCWVFLGPWEPDWDNEIGGEEYEAMPREAT